MSDQSGTGADGAATNDATEQNGSEQQPEWLTPINTRMDELREQNAAIVDRLERWQQQADEPPEGEPAEDDFGEEDYFDEEGEYTPEGARRVLDGLVDERLQSEFAKRDAVQALEQREDAFDALREEIPALQDDKLAAQLVRETAAYLEQNGRGELIDTPMFVDLLEDRYYAGQYRERVASEREAQPDREVVLESASGASAPSGKKEPDWGERIVKAAERLRPQI